MSDSMGDYLLAAAPNEVERLQSWGRIWEPEAHDCSYICYPPQPAWERLKALTAAAFERAGGDAQAGRRMYGPLRSARLEDVNARAVALALPAGRPYRRWPRERRP